MLTSSERYVVASRTHTTTDIAHVIKHCTETYIYADSVNTIHYYLTVKYMLATTKKTQTDTGAVKGHFQPSQLPIHCGTNQEGEETSEGDESAGRVGLSGSTPWGGERRRTEWRRERESSKTTITVARRP